ncbi:hypothetical protein [Campylobacter concisus]|uniref:hypothetical protein n=1 Tax=Campylobacter concisus TaxID=199 RepID=UPI0021564D9D
MPENETTAKATRFLPLIIAVLLLIALIFGLKLGKNGVFMQRSKFCSVGAISKIFGRDFSMFYGVVSIIVCASITNLVLNQYKFGFEAQPIAHNDMLWNFLGMTLAGLCFSLSYGCPGKHLVQMRAGITAYASYAVATLISTLFTLNFLPKKLN